MREDVHIVGPDVALNGIINLSDDEWFERVI